MTRNTRYRARVLLMALVASLARADVNAALTVIGVQYQKDKYFDEDNCLWHDRQYPPTVSQPCSINLFTGQVVKVFLKNTGASSVAISDATLAGLSLNQNIKSKDAGSGNIPYSIYYGSGANVTALENAGEPVWYKADPATVPVGGVAQVVVRLRQYPVTQPIAIGAVTTAGTVTTNITVDANAPVLASVGFSSDRTKVYLHWRRTGGAAPATVLMDGVDVTANATTVGDPTLNFGATVLQFESPIANMSFHVYQGVFSDGKRATGALRTWVNPFLYGTWAAKPTNPGEANGKTWVNEAVAHGVNCVVMNVASDGLSDLMGTPGGRQWMNDRGYGVVKDDPASASEILRMWFTRDEPDGADANMTGLPPGAGHNTGVLAMSVLQRGEVLRAAKADVPVTVNIDGNLKPYNYWNWGQVPDVFMTDPYYEPEVADAYWNHPEQIPLYARATQVYATARTTGLACEPNPLHVILYSNKQKNSDTGALWPFPAPGTKRTEVYYALAGGAKGMAYWWYKLPDGLGNNNAAAQALWKEIGLLGNEIKTAQPMLVTSHPVSLPTTATSGVWVRTLAVGNDAMIFLIVNDNHYNDSTGCHVTSITNATVNATLPSWLASATAFEIKPSGLSDVNASIVGTAMQLNLGTLQSTKMIVVTTNAQLRSTIQARYVQEVWPGICSFAPEYCTPQSSPPIINVQPASHIVAPGGSTTFTVVASGSDPLSYRWQKNNTNLNNGGHYSTTTTATLTISNADTNDVASYRCEVSNAHGTNISNPATLTVAVGCPPAVLANANFEGGNTSGVGSGWTSYQRAPNPAITLWSIQTASPPAGGVQYQQIANTNSAGGGGVRQDVTGCIIGATYTIAGWMRGNSGDSTCTVKCSPSASTSWATAVSLSPPQTVSGSTWTPFSGTVVATGTNMTLWLDGQTGGSGNFNAACFDSITVSCAGATVPPSITQQPSDRLVAPGGSTSFTVVASGSDPLNYQWKKNNVNLTNDNHYFGCTTETLEINGADYNDIASYRCVITNAYGSITSSPAMLTAIINCAGDLLNSDFEGDTNANGVATGWVGYQRTGTPAPSTVWTIQFAGPPAGGGLQYQQIANTSSTGGGGVRQDVTGCTVGATYLISGWMRGNSGITSTCRVKCSPTASTSWATAIDLNPPQVYTGNTWVQFSGTVVATGTNMTIWLDGQTTGTGQNKAECFDSVTVTCVAAPVPLFFESVALQPQNQVRLVVSGAVGGSVTILRSSNLVNWIVLTNLINTNGTLQFIDAPAANVERRFYRATSP